ncbi:MAG: hypothetical protein PF480_15255 [Roseovarius sp.]|jgi:hypothetical protein|nr:hypothetical protein [Roseovarius sp.]
MSEEPIGISSASSGTVILANRGTKQGEGVNIQYTTFPNNKPLEYANQFFVWESDSPNIPWDRDPIARVPVGQDQYTFTQFVKFNYQVGVGYVIGYAVANDPGAICSSIFYPANEQPGQGQQLKMAMGSYGPGYVEVSYDTLQQYNPVANHNYIAIWQAPQASYKGGEMSAASIQYPNTHGQATIMNVNLQINSTYSIGYFMKKAPEGKSALASELTFTT